MFGYDFYIRLNEKNEIIKCFTTGFEQPEEGDIRILENCDRCHSLQLIDHSTRNFKYKYVNNEVVEKTKEELEDQSYLDRIATQNAKQKLNDLDLKSMRDIREWISKQADASDYVKQYEAEAIVERTKIK